MNVLKRFFKKEEKRDGEGGISITFSEEEVRQIVKEEIQEVVEEIGSIIEDSVRRNMKDILRDQNRVISATVSNLGDLLADLLDVLKELEEEGFEEDAFRKLKVTIREGMDTLSEIALRSKELSEVLSELSQATEWLRETGGQINKLRVDVNNAFRQMEDLRASISDIKASIIQEVEREIVDRVLADMQRHGVIDRITRNAADLVYAEIAKRGEN